MLHTSTLLLFTLSLAEGPDAAELRAQAESKARERAYAEAGELFVKLAALPGVERRKEMFNAHTNLEAAYLTSHETRHLCRALGVAELVIREDGFKDEQMGQFWHDLVEEDLDRLRADAVKTKRPNCRFGETGKPRSTVPLIADGDLPPVRLNMSEKPVFVPKDAGPRPSRRYQTHTAAGALFTGVGISFLGLFAGAIGVQVDQVQAIRKQRDLVEGEGRAPTAGEQAWAEDRRETALQAQAVAIGVGTAGVVSLATGVALLATRKRHARPLALRPVGGAHGVGVLLRVRF